MKNLIPKFFPALACTLLLTTAATAQDHAASALGEKGPPLDPSKSAPVETRTDPRQAYRELIEAVRKCDLDAAVACFSYQEKDAEAIRVGVGIFIAHRRFEKAVDTRFGIDEKTRELLEGFLRPDVTDKALDLTAGQLATATVKQGDETVTIDMRWDEVDPDDDTFGSADFPGSRLLKVDGRWKLAPEEGEGADDFFEKGGWGNVFLNGMKMLDETSERLAKGDFKDVTELKAHLDERMKVLTEEYEKELSELPLPR